jgi:hypothetical protein
VTDDGDNQDTGPDEEEIPPPKIIKIEDYADISSPYRSLDGTTLAQPNGVAVARLASPEIGERDGDGVLIGESMADLAYVIGELGGTRGHVHVRELAFVASVDLAFVTSGEVEQTLTGADSKERRGADRLARALASPSAHALLETLRGIDDSLAVRFEALLKRLAESKVVLDFQTPARKRPLRVGPERATALYAVLRSPVELEPYRFTAIGRLVGAISDTKDFKLRLESPWQGRRVIEGKFKDGLERDMEQLWNKNVRADIYALEERRGVRTTSYKYRLEGIHPASTLPFEE